MDTLTITITTAQANMLRHALISERAERLALARAYDDSTDPRMIAAREAALAEVEAADTLWSMIATAGVREST